MSGSFEGYKITERANTFLSAKEQMCEGMRVYVCVRVKHVHRYNILVFITSQINLSQQTGIAHQLRQREGERERGAKDCGEERQTQ